MDGTTPVQTEESRTIAHLEHLGYTVEPDVEPRGWRFATSALGRPFTFRVSDWLLFLYAEYSAGPYSRDAFRELLEEVNRFNAENWLVRVAVDKKQGRGVEECFFRLRAHIPTGLPTVELGGYLVHWFRESAQADRLAHASAASSGGDDSTDDE